MNRPTLIATLALMTALGLGACRPPATPETAAAPAPAVAPGAIPMPGQVAPGFTLVDGDGKPRALADFNGQVVVLEWTNEDCPYVRKHYAGAMQALQREAGEDGVVWLSVISSAPGTQGYVTGEAAHSWNTRTGAHSTHLLLDPTGQVGKAYGAKTTPDMRIINRDGRLVYVGGIDDRPTTDVADLQGAVNFVRAALDDLLSERPIRRDFAASYGCSVKYAGTV